MTGVEAASAELNVDVRFQGAEVEAALFGQRPKVEVGRYEVLSRLGRGGMGSVFVAHDPELDRRIAIKVLHRSTQGPTASERLVREAQAMARLSHPNVLEVFEVGIDRGQVFVAMELVDGGSLLEWSRQPHTVDEICVAYLQAAQGLAAAHSAGIVHRDFKPHNVLVDASGRVRVMDFGLAGELDTLGHAAASSSSHSGSTRDRSLTRTGALVGTPAYMSPEQHRGEQATPRSDQWSFCVALFESLYGRLPFDADTRAALGAAIEAGEIHEPDRGPPVPVWLRAVVRRGLQPDPQARFASMTALIAAIREGPARASRRRTLLLAGGSGLVLTMAALAFAASPKADGRCDADDAPFEGVWDDTRRAEVDASIGRSGTPQARWTAQRVTAALDDYTAGWTTAHTAACVASDKAGPATQGPVVDLTLQCLDRRRDAVAALVDVLSGGGLEVVESTVAANLGLASVQSCADPTQPSAAMPEDPTAAAEVVRIREALTLAQAHRAAGNTAASRAVVEPLVEPARQLAFAPLLAETLLLVGRLADNPAEAEPPLQEAYFAAKEAGDWSSAGEAATLLVTVVGDRLERHEAGLSWARHARSALTRQGRTPGRDLLNAMGDVVRNEGKPQEALALYRESLALERTDDAVDEIAIADALEGIGRIHLELGAYDDALDHFERAQRIFESRLGPLHPRVASTMSGVGETLKAMGKPEEALAQHRRAASLVASALGPDHALLFGYRLHVSQSLAGLGRIEEALEEANAALATAEASRPEGHPEVAKAHALIGMQLAKLGRYDEALARFVRAQEIFEATFEEGHPSITQNLERIVMVHFSTQAYDRALEPMTRALQQTIESYGSDHPQVGRAESNLGIIYMNLGKNELALGHLTRALEIGERTLEPDHPSNAIAHANLAEVLTNLGDYDQALEHFGRALEIQRAKFGDRHRDIAYSLQARAKVHQRAGHAPEARADAEASLEIYAVIDAPPTERAAVRFILAELVWASGRQRDQARAHMTEAAQEYRDAGVEFEHRAREAEAWLADHPA